MGISRVLADFAAGIRYEDIPEHVITTQKKSILDNLGIIMGASSLGDGCRAFVGTAKELAAGGRPEACVPGFGLWLPAVWAAFANASMSHSLDFGDTQMKAVIHSNASVFPAALAVAQKLGNVSGRDFLTALVAGSETACRIAMGVHEDLEKYGFYMPTIYTSFGAAAAAAKLMQLSAEEIVNAFSLNLCQTTCSAELMNNAETQIRSVREAFAARNAVVSAELASRGVVGFRQPLEGERGFYRAYARTAGDEQAALAGLGEHYEAGDLYFKLWPSCAGTHPVIRLLLQLTREHELKPVNIRRIHVVCSQRNRMLLEPEALRRNPETPIIAKFSIPYTGAIAVIRGRLTLGDFSPESLKDPEVRGLAARFTHEVNESWSKREGMNTEVTVYTADGSAFRAFSAEQEGQTAEPSFAELKEKYLACAVHAVQPLSREQLLKAADLVEHLEQEDSLEELADILGNVDQDRTTEL